MTEDRSRQPRELAAGRGPAMGPGANARRARLARWAALPIAALLTLALSGPARPQIAPEPQPTAPSEPAPRPLSAGDPRPPSDSRAETGPRAAADQTAPTVPLPADLR